MSDESPELGVVEIISLLRERDQKQSSKFQVSSIFHQVDEEIRYITLDKGFCFLLFAGRTWPVPMTLL